MITAETVQNLSLARAFRGYDVRAVDDFLDQVAHQLAQDVQSMEELRGNLLRSNEEKSRLKRQIEALEAEQEDSAAARRRLQQELDGLKELVAQQDKENERVSESLMDIYRMREAILKDAATQADETKKAAETALAQAQSRADQIVSDAFDRKSVLDAEYHALYRKMSDFRTQIMDVYRRQMEALNVFPEESVYEISGPVTIIQENME